MPLLSLKSAAMLCRVDPLWSLGLGLPFHRRMGPMLFRAGGRELCLLPLHPAVTAAAPAVVNSAQVVGARREVGMLRPQHLEPDFHRPPMRRKHLLVLALAAVTSPN